MTTLTVDHRTFARMRLALSTPSVRVSALAGDAFRALWRSQVQGLGRAPMNLCLALLDLTIGTGRAARDLTIKELAEGLDDSPGCGVSPSNVKEALKVLEESGIVCRIKRAGASAAKLSAMFAINFKAVLGDIADHIAQFLPDLTAPKGETDTCLWPASRPRQYIDTLGISYPYKEEINLFLSRSEVARHNANVSGEPMQQEGSAADVVRAIQARQRERAATRVQESKGRSPARLTRVQVQDILDAARRAAGLTHRVLATDREVGFLRKRLVSYEVGDFAALVTHTFIHWGTYARQNASAQLKRGATEKALPPAPDFASLVYRLPYFLKAYNNHLAGVAVQEDMAAVEARQENGKLAEMANQLRRAEQENRSLRRLVRSRPAAPEATHSPTVVATQIVRGADDELPEWR